MHCFSWMLTVKWIWNTDLWNCCEVFIFLSDDDAYLVELTFHNEYINLNIKKKYFNNNLKCTYIAKAIAILSYQVILNEVSIDILSRALFSSAAPHIFSMKTNISRTDMPMKIFSKLFGFRKPILGHNFVRFSCDRDSRVKKI